MEAARARQLVEAYLDAYNRFDVAGMLAGLHDNLVFENVSSGTVTLATHGKAEFQMQAEQAATYFTKREQRVTDWQPLTNDTLAVAIDYAGVLAIDLPNGPRAGDTLRLQGRSVFRFADDQIISLTDIS